MPFQNSPADKIFLLYYFVIPVISFISRDKMLRIIEFSCSLMMLYMGIIVAQCGSILNIFLSFFWGVLSLIFTISLTLSDKSVLQSALMQIGEVPEKIVKHPGKATRVMLSVVQEELIWRAVFVYLVENILTGRIYIILMGSFLFYLVHFNSMRPVIFIAHLEFILFTVFIYVIFLQTGSVIAVSIIHFMRNIFILQVVHDGPVHD